MKRSVNTWAVNNKILVKEKQSLPFKKLGFEVRIFGYITYEKVKGNF